VLEQIGRTLGAKGDLVSHIGARELVLVLDNLEQAIDAAPALADLVERCGNLQLLVTSRELLRVRGEVEFALEPLSDGDAVTLFSGSVPGSRSTVTPQWPSAGRSTTSRSRWSLPQRGPARSPRSRCSSESGSGSTS
jgi:hypothetical protein